MSFKVGDRVEVTDSLPEEKGLIGSQGKVVQVVMDDDFIPLFPIRVLLDNGSELGFRERELRKV